VCSQEIWVWDPNIAKWCGKLQHFTPGTLDVHLVILEGCILYIFGTAAHVRRDLIANLRLEPNCPHEQQATQVVWTNLHRQLQA